MANTLQMALGQDYDGLVRVRHLKGATLALQRVREKMNLAARNFSATAEETVVRSQPSAFSIGMISTPGVARTPAEHNRIAKTMPATIQP